MLTNKTQDRKLFFLFFTLVFLISLSACTKSQYNSTASINYPIQKKINNSSAISNQSPNQQNKLYICENISRFVDKKVGNGECVDLLKACAKTPNTTAWQEGKSVWGNSIPTGTAIATFKGSKYPNKSGYHAAIYVSQDEKGIYVWDQWRGKNVHLRLIRFDNFKKKPGNDASRYNVITQ